MTQIKQIHKLIQPLQKHPCIVFSEDFKAHYPDKFDDVSIKDIRVFLQNEEGGNDPLFVFDNASFRFETITLNEQHYHVVTKEDSDQTFIDKYRTLFDGLEEKIFIFRGTKLVFHNHSANLFLNLDVKNYQNIKYDKFLDKDSLKRLHNFINRGQSGMLELKVITSEDKKHDVNASISVYDYADYTYFIVILRDLSEMKDEYTKTNTEKEYFLHTLNSIGEAIIITDQNNVITRVNENALMMTGLSDDTYRNQPIQSVLTLLDEAHNSVDYLALDEYTNSDALLVSQDGMYWHVNINIRNIEDNHDQVLGKVYVIVDINEQKKREKEVLYLSYHDILTGLYNRSFLEEEIRRLDTERQLPFSLIMGDVNGLKLTNDVFGHEVGDQLLKKVGKSLQFLCRNEDIVGRWGGDEFVILLPQTDSNETNIIMNRIIDYFGRMSTKDMIKGMTPSISLGYCVKRYKTDNIMEVMRVAETNMYKRKMLSKTSMHSKIIESMQKALHEKSDETESHGNRLFQYLKGIAESYGLSNDMMDDLQLLCMLHDLGKIGVNDDVLQKKGKLTDEEWIEMRRHPEIGYRIAQASPGLENVSKYILSHHERYDGTGYPKGLKGQDIPLLSRMLSVADAYDAMTTSRPYNTVKPQKEALKELEDHSGTQFDPEIVSLFVKQMNEGISDA
ncbi:MAG: diguanylate cyclase [Candidatus Izimaplasma sp.]|nr:diguanylate cyclase [Candidatus Izimaplasma bacterium]